MAVKTICFVAGYSAGHILPCIALRKTQYQDAKIIFFATTKKLDQELLKKESSFITIFLSLQRTSHMHILNYFILLWQFMYATIKSIYTLSKHRPERVVATGSFIALPVCYAARLLWIPIDIYELNAQPGRANKHLARFAERIFVCFKRSKEQLQPFKTILIDYPQITHPIKTTKKNKKPIILVLGGSQGSTSLNTIVCDLLIKNSLLYHDFHWIHQTGSDEYEKIAHWYQDKTIQNTVLPFSDNIEHYMQQANLIICRAGAGTLFSLVTHNKPCITIPLNNVADNHQLLNAQELKKEYNELIDIIDQKKIEQNNLILYQHIVNKLYITSK
jgi:UDP-N-acetylglucosamine--N-acetylmuramyl-(pentapeptide) pyrophosphoryl-undecaprenol N-acetylglucosamine transferase